MTGSEILCWMKRSYTTYRNSSGAEVEGQPQSQPKLFSILHLSVVTKQQESRALASSPRLPQRCSLIRKSHKHYLLHHLAQSHRQPMPKLPLPPIMQALSFLATAFPLPPKNTSSLSGLSQGQSAYPNSICTLSSSQSSPLSSILGHFKVCSS